MQREGDEVNYVTVAKIAGVSRQYLYARFRKEIEALRHPAHRIVVEVDNIKEAVRTTGRVSVVELALRNKVKRLEAELARTRSALAAKEQEYAKALGEAEHWRGKLVEMFMDSGRKP